MIAPFSAKTIAMLQQMAKGMLVDDIEIMPMAEVEDSYGVIMQKYPSVGNFCKGSIQAVIRIPGTPEIGGTTTVVGNFQLKLAWDAMLPNEPQKCQFIVNGGDKYEAENVYRDKANKVTILVYCNRVE